MSAADYQPDRTSSPSAGNPHVVLTSWTCRANDHLYTQLLRLLFQEESALPPRS